MNQKCSEDESGLIVEEIQSVLQGKRTALKALLIGVAVLLAQISVGGYLAAAFRHHAFIQAMNWMDILAALGMILLGAAIYLVVGLLIRIHCLNRRSAAYSHDTEKNERKLLGKIDDWETQRWQGEQTLRRSQEELRNLSAHLESVREEERTRLAREIHDELGQTMTVLKMDISWLNRRLDPQRTALHKKNTLHGSPY
jgi:signal transduction histidine kinase